MDFSSEVVKEWFDSANEDFEAAQHLWEFDRARFFRVVLFHCQQAAEKSIKGYLAYKRLEFPKTHDLGHLATLLVGQEPKIEALLMELNFLTPYAIESRYPRPITRQRTEDEARAALEIAEKVLRTMTLLTR